MSDMKSKLILAPVVAAGLAFAMLPLAACSFGGGDDAVPTEQDIEESADSGKTNKKKESGGQSGGSGGGGNTGNGSAGGSQEPAEAEIITNTIYTPDDFMGQSGIYNSEITQVTNAFSFNVEGLGTWKLIGIMDENGKIYDGEAVDGNTTITLLEGGYGSFNQGESAKELVWTQYKDFPQLGMGNIDGHEVLTMEINNQMHLTAKQDTDGQIMLFEKVMV